MRATAVILDSASLVKPARGPAAHATPTPRMGRESWFAVRCVGVGSFVCCRLATGPLTAGPTTVCLCAPFTTWILVIPLACGVHRNGNRVLLHKSSSLSFRLVWGRISRSGALIWAFSRKNAAAKRPARSWCLKFASLALVCLPR